MIIHSWCQGRLLLRERCSRFFKRTEYKNSIDKADIHSAREDNPGSSGKTRTRLPTEWARLEEVERACRALRKLGAGVVGRRGVGRGAGAWSCARLWSCSVWQSPGFHSAVPHARVLTSRLISIFFLQYHIFFSLLVFCRHVCKHRCSFLVLVKCVFDDAEALFT